MLKPQYNLKRYVVTRDKEFFKNKFKVEWVIPVKIRNLLGKCLDPKALHYNLCYFTFLPNKRIFYFKVLTPKGFIICKSSG